MSAKTSPLPATRALSSRRDTLVHIGATLVDFPYGAPTPQLMESIYPLVYGYLAGTTVGDASGNKVWLGSGADKAATALVCKLDLFKRDAAFKPKAGCTEVIVTVSRFMNVTAGLPCCILKRT